MVHSFSDQHSTLATETKKASKNPILKMLDSLIPPASSKLQVQPEEENVTSTFATKQKYTEMKEKKKKRVPVDEIFDGVDDEILGE